MQAPKEKFHKICKAKVSGHIRPKLEVVIKSMGANQASNRYHSPIPRTQDHNPKHYNDLKASHHQSCLRYL